MNFVYFFVFIQNQNNFVSWLLVSMPVKMNGTRKSVKGC